MTAIAVSDLVEVLTRAIEVVLGPGVRRINVASPQARTPAPTADALRKTLGERTAMLDLSRYEEAGHEYDTLFSTERLIHTYGYPPRTDVRTLTAASSGAEPMTEVNP